MGERKGQNKYYPPDFDYKKHKSLAGYHGEHPLRERARKLHMGILIIRFEMPYNIWCGGCNKHIAMGVRYNAEKSKIGMYYTTPIYKFRMKCHLCDNHFEIKTDPANHDYVIISGARRKEQRWDPHENEQIVPEDRATQKKLALDSMYKLEHGVDDQSRAKSTAPTIAKVVQMQAGLKDDYLLNQLARRCLRDAKKITKEKKLEDDRVKEKFSLDVELVPENVDDVRIAELLKYSTVESYDDRQKAIRGSIISRPLFASAQSKTSESIVSISSSSQSSSSSSSTSLSKRETVARICQISDASRAKRQSATFLSGNCPTKRTLQSRKRSLGVTAKSMEQNTVDNTDDIESQIKKSRYTDVQDSCQLQTNTDRIQQDSQQSTNNKNDTSLCSNDNLAGDCESVVNQSSQIKVNSLTLVSSYSSSTSPSSDSD